MTTGDDDPVGAEERDALLAPLASFPAIVLAVSGGSDSTALLHLVHGWTHARRRSLRSLIAVTVDHGLRPEAATEAEAVANQARGLGIEHRTVHWSGPVPATRLQAAARKARYRLLSEVAREHAATLGSPAVIVTAHTADDQAETLIMRLARGSGVDGLASIPRYGAPAIGTPLGAEDTCQVFRPLLTVARRRLLATLAASAIPFSEDPSNRDPRFERVRVRRALDVLETLGLTREALQRSAHRLQSAREVLERAADALEARSVTSIASIVYELDLVSIADAPRETGVRVFRRSLAYVGGAAPVADLGTVEAAFARLIATPDAPAFTLGGCIVDVVRSESSGCPRVRIYREPDRNGGLPRLRLAPGQAAHWDERFHALVSESHTGSVEIGPLGDDWQALLGEFPAINGLRLPRAAARGIPVFRQGGQRLAAPVLSELLERIGEVDVARQLASPTGPSSDGGTAPVFVLIPLRSGASGRRGTTEAERGS